MGDFPVTALTERMGLRLEFGPETRRFLNWILIWVILANIGFMALWLVGAPPRVYEIMMFGSVGLLVKRFGLIVQFTAFMATMCWSVMTFVGGLFNLNISSLLYSIRFFLEIKPSNSMEYIAAGLSLVGTIFAVFRLMRRDTNFSSSPLIISAGLIFIGLALTDYQMGKGMRGHYQHSAPNGAVFGSATNASHFVARADGKRNLMLVVMESMGVSPNNPEIQRLLFAQYKNSPALRERYDISQGISPYYVSTTAGEVRELCGRWGDYYDLLDRRDDNCLPAKLAKRGYDTVAMHSFTGGFFERETWYPHIGFRKRMFRDDLLKDGAQYCGGVFAGACDRDIPRQIGSILKNAKEPTFLYWLTLNSHLPVPPGLNLNVENCARISPILAREFPQICRQFAIWHDVEAAMVKILTDPEFPETDILIVGDHMPPYFDQHHRSQFDPEHVPWLYLRAKGADKPN